MLEVRDVVTSYGMIQALRGVSLTAREGEVTCILGPNGAGKTTLLYTVAGILRPRSGSLTLQGRGPAGAARRRGAPPPRLLMMDEPALGLAPLVVEQIFQIVQGLNREGITVLLVEQNARLPLSIAHPADPLAQGRSA